MIYTEDKWFQGYEQAVRDYGIWRSGEQHIGCQETPVKEVIARAWKGRYPDCTGYGCEGCPGCEGVKQ